MQYIVIQMALVLCLTGFQDVSGSTSLIATDDAQYIESYGYSSYINYANSLYQTWSVKTQDVGKNVEVEIDMNIEYHYICAYDYIALYDAPYLWFDVAFSFVSVVLCSTQSSTLIYGFILVNKFSVRTKAPGDSSTSPLLDKHCGTSADTAALSTGREMYIVFSTDSSVQKRGFRLKYYQITDESNKLWVILGVLLSVIIVLLSVGIIICLCCWKAKQDQVAPIHIVHHTGGQHQQHIWTTPPAQQLYHNFVVAGPVQPRPPPLYTAAAVQPPCYAETSFQENEDLLPLRMDKR